MQPYQQPYVPGMPQGQYRPGMPGMAGMQPAPYNPGMAPMMPNQGMMPPPMGMAGPGMVDPYMQSLRQRFDSVDIDKSGSIEYQEIHKLFSNPADPIEFNCARMIISIFSSTGSINFQQFIECDKFLKSVDAQFVQADKNRNGKVEFNEFLISMKISFPQFAEPNLQAVFKRFSKDPARQCLTYSEFLTIVVFLTLIKMKFTSWDAQRTGRISLDIQSMLISLLWFV